MARPRSTMLVTIGAAVFIAGAGLAFFVVRDGDDDSEKAAAVETSKPAPPAAGAVTAPGAAPATPVAFTIPEGMQAVAVQVPFVQGIAGYAKAADKVNVYGVFKNNGGNTQLKQPAAKLVLDKVEVLSVTAPSPGAGAGNATYLLALSAEDAEQVVYLQSHESVYLTLARTDQPLLSTPGRTPANAA